jgi:hypothetical protein
MRSKKRMHRTRERLFSRSGVTRPSLGPPTRARQSLLQLRARKRSEVARSKSVSRSGKPAQAGGTGTGADIGRTMGGSPRATASARKVVRDA